MKEYKTYETERLILRPTSLDDGDFILKLLNTPKWHRYIGDRNVKTIEEALDYIRIKMLPQLQKRGFSNNTLIRKSDSEKLGVCGLFDREGIEGLDIGYALLPEFEKEGYAYEASFQVLKIAKDELKVPIVKAITSKENLASQNLLKKLGFENTGSTILPDENDEVLIFSHRF